MSDYIPATDEGFRTWAESYATGISNDPPKFMLTSAQAASIQSVVDDFVAKLAISSNEATRTKATVIAKNDSRSICESLCRDYAILIKENGGISDGDKVSIGVRPENTTREPIDAPTTEPLVSVLGNTPGTQTLRYSDSSTPDSKLRPFGAAGLQLFLAITAEGDAAVSEAKLHSLNTRNPIAVEFSEADDGKVATYYARWYSAKGEVGPWSIPVSMRIAA